MIRKIVKHYSYIKICGLSTYIKTIYNHIRYRDYTDFALQKKRQEYYEGADKEIFAKELTRYYFIKTGHKLHLENPKRFTEKIQWMKLYGFGDKETLLADKYLVREWIENKIGGDYLIPIYGVWDSPDEIDYKELPDSFVLKGNHGSHMNFIVENKKDLDISKVNIVLSRWLDTNFAYCLGGFEMQYLKIPRKIIAEKYMKDEKNKDLRDYKFHCFDGTPYFCEVISDRNTNECIDYYDMNWVHQDFIDEPISSSIKNSLIPIERPVLFDEMKYIAEILSQEFNYVRVDLYEIENKVYFGEMTFTPSSGTDEFTPDDADFMLGKLYQLPEKIRQN